ncbi:MAG: PAS domain-containing protein [Candidatus Omnitrophica bacterium]|nr:PAS domain-containing protein [Candidatus Omnitrophota bacterium]
MVKTKRKDKKHTGSGHSAPGGNAYPGLILRFDGQGRLLYATRSLERITGRRTEDLLGRTLKANGFFSSPRRWKELIDAVLREGEERYCELRINDGKEVKPFFAQAVPEKDPETGRAGTVFVAGLYGSPEQPEKEELASSFRGFYRILEELPMGIVTMSKKKNRITYANRRARKLYGVEGVEGLEMKDHSETLRLFNSKGEMYEPEDLPLSRSLVKGEEVSREEVIIRSPSGERTVIAGSSPLFMDNGEIVGAIASFTEITDIKREQEDLEREKGEKQTQLDETHKKLDEAQRLSDIGTLASVIAHELRNPLGVISTAVYNCERKNRDNALEKHFTNIKKKIKESEHIINNLLNFARVKLPVIKKVEIKQIIDSCLDSAAQKYTRKSFKLSRDLSEIKGLTVEADPYQVQQVLANMVNNAIEAVPEGEGRVEAKGRLCRLGRRKAFRIEIKDNGPGIEKILREKIFEPFFTTKSKGTGLGLAVCAQLVGLHEGRIDLASAKGKGTTVSVTLPVHGKNERKRREL